MTGKKKKNNGNADETGPPNFDFEIKVLRYVDEKMVTSRKCLFAAVCAEDRRLGMVALLSAMDELQDLGNRVLTCLATGRTDPERLSEQEITDAAQKVSRMDFTDTIINAMTDTLPLKVLPGEKTKALPKHRQTRERGPFAPKESTGGDQKPMG